MSVLDTQSLGLHELIDIYANVLLPKSQRNYDNRRTGQRLLTSQIKCSERKPPPIKNLGFIDITCDNEVNSSEKRKINDKKGETAQINKRQRISWP